MLGGTGDNICGRFIEWNNLVTACTARDDTEGSTDMAGKLGDGVDLSIAIDLDADQNKVARGESGS
jgi:hypothetical protein